MERKTRTGIALAIAIALVVIAATVAAITLGPRLLGTADGTWHGNTDTTQTQQGTAPAQQVHVDNIASPVDFNHNGVDDYADIVAGARADAQAMPTYDDSYYQGGYPPDDRGACTDLVWRAFRQAGYSLKDMVDADIATHPEHYPAIAAPDPNIDFRRATTLDAFFAAYGQTLTTDVNDAAQWQPGDIVVFRNGTHIGVASDRRDARGIPLLLHNNKQKQREEDYLTRVRPADITGHYRFDASQVPADVLKAWA